MVLEKKFKAGVAQGVERNLAKVEVEGSNLFSPAPKINIIK